MEGPHTMRKAMIALSSAVLIAGASPAYAGGALAENGRIPMQHQSTDEQSIRSVLASYNDALNGGQTAAVLPLYTEDGVFMPPYSQSAVGKEAVRKAYDAVFEELKFQVKFNVAELVVMA